MAMAQAVFLAIFCFSYAFGANANCPDAMKAMVRERAKQFAQTTGQRASGLLGPKRVTVTQAALPTYGAMVAPDTIEVLHVPSAYDHLGHTAIRVGQDVFHIEPGGKIVLGESLDSFNQKFSQHLVFGYVMPATAGEAQAIRDHYAGLPSGYYSLHNHNCFTTVCGALVGAGVLAPTSYFAKPPLSLDPVLARPMSQSTGRISLWSLYNVETSDDTTWSLISGKFRNRVPKYLRYFR